MYRFKHTCLKKDISIRLFHGSFSGNMQRSTCGATSASSPHSLPPRSTQQLGEYVSRELDGSIIDFSVGQPSPRLLPLEAIRAAAAARLNGERQQRSTHESDDAALLLQYGPRQGYPSFR